MTNDWPIHDRYDPYCACKRCDDEYSDTPVRTDRCLRCDRPLGDGRNALGYDHCAPCVEADWRLVNRTSVIIHGQHKGQPLVSRPDQTIANYRKDQP